MAKIYTRTGDEGVTSLVGGGRAPKDSPAIEAGGDIDELCASVGAVRAHPLPDGVDDVLQSVQECLFRIGIEVATPTGTSSGVPCVADGDVVALERQIDAFEAEVPPLRRFVLPGGSQAGAALHLARAVARRAERRCVALSRDGGVAPAAVRWLNRLSDLLFVLARYVNMEQSATERSPDLARGR
ncbi:MAG: cob(I)yrinic acid a,c-diamide adenosyltransferase [Acidobacteriota bacterium]|nr:cob(I)yrinic acid a,c-diamide adenosyltransferase [Acidobacteriota bacterium]